MRNKIRTLLHFFTPFPYRFLLTGETRVALYLKSGQVIKTNCRSYKVTLADGQTSYEFSGINPDFAINASQLVAVREVKWF